MERSKQRNAIELDFVLRRVSAANKKLTPAVAQRGDPRHDGEVADQVSGNAWNRNALDLLNCGYRESR